MSVYVCVCVCVYMYAHTYMYPGAVAPAAVYALASSGSVLPGMATGGQHLKGVLKAPKTPPQGAQEAAAGAAETGSAEEAGGRERRVVFVGVAAESQEGDLGKGAAARGVLGGKRSSATQAAMRGNSKGARGDDTVSL